MAFLSLIYIFLDKYLVPFFFAIGLFYFVYGVIEYFIIGAGGDEERAEHGRELFLKSIAWFALALLIFVFVSVLGWLSTLSFSPGGVDGPRGGVGADVDREQEVLEVPNVPSR